MQRRRTKIIGTIGPSSSSITMLTRMMKAGMTVARLNLSHGRHEEHAHLIRAIHTAAKKAGIQVAILEDLQGPRIRVGELPKHGIELRAKQTISFCAGDCAYEPGGHIPTTYPLYKDVAANHRIFLNEGLLEVEVTRVQKEIVYGVVKIGGVLTSHKGINLPDSKVTAPAFTKKDKEDLLFGLEHGIDWVALSFVSSPQTVAMVQQLIAQRCRDLGRTPPKLLAKIERKEAVDQFHEILEVVDGIMLARGDLGIEIPFEQVPLIQKEFTEICRQAGKPIIVATHMLDSMSENPRATRAEISDVANAVIDHADAVMLSAETAMGKYPDIAVQTMATVIDEVEASRLDDITFFQIHSIPDITTALAQAVHTMAENNHIGAIATAESYNTIVSKINVFRPNVPIILACASKEIAQQYVLRAGFTPIVMEDHPSTFVHRMEAYLRKNKFVQKNTRIAYLLESTKGDSELIIR